MEMGSRCTVTKRGHFPSIKTKRATYDLCLGASEVQEHHAHAVVRWHPEAFEGLLEQDTFPDAHFLREQRETLVNVYSQGALLAVPTAGWRERRDRTHVKAMWEFISREKRCLPSWERAVLILVLKYVHICWPDTLALNAATSRGQYNPTTGDHVKPRHHPDKGQNAK